MPAGGIRTRDPSKLEAAESRLRLLANEIGKNWFFPKKKKKKK